MTSLILDMCIRKMVKEECGSVLIDSESASDLYEIEIVNIVSCIPLWEIANRIQNRFDQQQYFDDFSISTTAENF